MINDEARRIIRDFPLGIIATITPDGRPAASPKGTFLVLDDTTIAYGDIRSPGTRRNLQKTPTAEVVFVDSFRRKGVRLRGTTEVVDSEAARFKTLITQWFDTWGDLARRINALVLIHVDAAKPLATPPYDDGATEAEMIAMYRDKYAKMFPES
ncbi:MAG: pyridoxamine 5'-phosphate oxidase family protein [Boseongicola sp.]|nr:pyridoxamine 5'-phosphate oxidase family protein [Boseongicola sp.]MBT8474298.1 pyridoxamine 5'-phosphate oxidase family protein [Alphaproteobacteria bacterium]